MFRVNVIVVENAIGALQILNEAVCVSIHANVLRKVMNLFSSQIWRNSGKDCLNNQHRKITTLNLNQPHSAKNDLESVYGNKIFSN